MENGLENKEEEKMSENVVEPVVPVVDEVKVKSHVRRLKVIKHVNSIAVVHSETQGTYSCVAPTYAKTEDRKTLAEFSNEGDAVAFASGNTEYKRKRGRPKKTAATCEVEKGGEENKG